MDAIKIKSLSLVLLFASLAYGEVETIGPFGGVNNSENPFVISATQAQDILNVELSKSGKSIKKRKGYGTAFTLSIATSPVHGIYNFYDSNGADVSLFFNDRRMSVSVSGGSPSVFFSTGPNGATYQCVDTAGFAYCANTSRANIIKVNSSTYTLLTGFTSTGTMVTATPERLVQAGFSDFPNMIWFAKSNDNTTWQVGGNGVDPIQFTITSPGSSVKHITYAHGRVYWFKDSSFGYILEGASQSDWQVVTISNFLGSLFNTSIYRDEILYFQGNDGHFYAYDGSNLAKLSKDLNETIGETQGRTSNSWTQSSQNDFESGRQSSTTAVAVPGSVVLASTSGIRIDGSRNTTSECTSGIYTTPYYVAQSFYSTRTFTATEASVLIQKIGSPGTVYVNLMSDTIVSSTHAPNVVLTSGTFDTSGVGATSATVKATFLSSTTLAAHTTYWLQLRVDGTADSSNRYDWQYGIGASEFDTFWCSPVPTTGGAVQLWFKINEKKYYPTGTFDSQVHNAASLSDWDSFQVDYLNNGGSNTFYIRSSTGVFYASATVPSWTSITNGSIPTISTNPYFQIRDVMVTADDYLTPSMESFTQNWFEGSASDKTYATYHDDALWWNVASGTGATTNNKILRFDLLNPGWYIYDIGTGGFLLRGKSLYFGSVDAGKIFKYGDVDNDNGSAINSYWKSKDFAGASPFVDKDYTRMSSAWSAISNSTATITYTIDGLTETSYNVNLGSATSSFIQKNVNFTQGKTGKTISVQFGNNAADQRWELFGSQIEYILKSWTPK
jgi:hypothetical protein